MATIEKRGNQYRVVFWFRGERFSRSLRTTNEREALSRLARLDDNLRRFELGLLTSPDDADLTTFLLSDGRTVARPSLRAVRTLDQLLNAYFKAIPVDSIEPLTISGMENWRGGHLPWQRHHRTSTAEDRRSIQTIGMERPTERALRRRP